MSLSAYHRRNMQHRSLATTSEENMIRKRRSGWDKNKGNVPVLN
jgi:hypothetical protein